MTKQLVLDILGWVLIAGVLLIGVVMSIKGRQLRAARQRKKADRMQQATARYYASTDGKDAGPAAGPALSDVEELEKCFHSEPEEEKTEE